MPELSADQRRKRRELRRRRTLRRRRASFGIVALLAVGLGIGLTHNGAGADRKAKSGVSSTTKLIVKHGSAGSGSSVRQTGSGRPVTLAFGGDVHFEGIVRSKLDSSPASVMSAIAPVLKRADLAMVNLETTVSLRGTPTPGKAYTFRAPPSAFTALKDGGVDVATIANNHGVDYGMVSFLDTLKYAKRHHFPLVGGGYNSAQAYAPYRTTIKGERIAILGATQVIDSNLISSWTAGVGKPGLASAYDVPRLLSAVRKARKLADTVVVYLHYGIETQSCPSSDQIKLARQLTGAGADIVVGSHAHRLQGAGRLGKAMVDYGLGNFVWYSQNSVASVTTGVLKITVTGRHIDSYNWVPATIIGGSPTPLGGSARSSAIASWRTLRSCTNLRS
jgi:poly-gamma-glutamate synthesis protein (capsule biosynthesis protein)